MSILATAALQHYGLGSLPVYLCDSFAGLPMPRKGSLGASETYYAKFMNRTLAVGEQRVLGNFDRFGVPRGQVTTWPGYFVDSLPPLRDRLLTTGERLSILRMDGDSECIADSTCQPRGLPCVNPHHQRRLRNPLHAPVYDSTADILYNLYDLVSPGGYVIVDDFGWTSGIRHKAIQSGHGNSTPFRALFGAKNALLDFRALHGLEDGNHIMVNIDGTGAYFVRSSSLHPLPNASRQASTPARAYHRSTKVVRCPVRMAWIRAEKGQRGDGTA